MTNKDRFYQRKWGVFNHLLEQIQNNPDAPHSYGKTTDWDTLIKGIDTDKIAKTLHEMGAGYYVITVMQGSKHMIAPNATFDRIANTSPGEACSTRDLVLDLLKSLAPYDIDLFLYFTGDGPCRDHREAELFDFPLPWGRPVTKDFVDKWSSVLEEYALRYGDRIKGWWIDGCYRKSLGYTDELLEKYYRACKKGNPDALVALNNGVSKGGLENGCDFEDFLCGERNDFDLIPQQRFYKNSQAHLLAPLGISEENNPFPQTSGAGGWGCFGLKRSKEYLADYVSKVHNAGGVVSIDIGLYRDGSFDQKQVEALTYLGKHIKK